MSAPDETVPDEEQKAIDAEVDRWVESITPDSLDPEPWKPAT